MGGIINKFFVIVPHQHIYIVEHFGKYYKTLDPGYHYLIPFIQRVAHKHSLKEQSFLINAQNAVTKDNVIIQTDGILYLKINDPIQCSYGAEDPLSYVNLLAQSIMRSEIGKLTLDQTFEERVQINTNILKNLKGATEPWGLQCIRYEIKDIKVSDKIKNVMNLEAESERKKRADILLSEGKRNSDINIAEATKNSQILRAQGQGEQIILQTKAVVKRLENISKSLENSSGMEAAKYNLAQQYISAFEGLSSSNKSIYLDLNLMNIEQILKKSMKLMESQSDNQKQGQDNLEESVKKD